MLNCSNAVSFPRRKSIVSGSVGGELKMGFVNKSVPSALGNAARGGFLSEEKNHHSIKPNSLLSQH